MAQGALSAPRLHAPRFQFLVAVIGGELALAFILASATPSPRLVLGIALPSFAVLLCVVAPRAALTVLVALWGIAHTVLADFELTQIGAVQLSLSRALGFVIVLGFGVSLLALKASGRGQSFPLPLKALILFAVVFAWDAGFARSRADGLSDLLRVLSGVVIGLIAFHIIDTPVRLLAVSRWAKFAGVAVAVVTLVEFLLPRVDPQLADSMFGQRQYAYSYSANFHEFAARPRGPLGGPGETANFLFVAAAFALLRYTLLRDRRQAKGELIALSIIGLGILATLTRTGIVAFVVLLIAWSLQGPVRSIAIGVLRMRVLVALTLFALSAPLLMGSHDLRSRLWDINPISSGSSFGQGRGEVWSQELATLKGSSPMQLLVGHGAHSSYVSISNRGASVEESPHNLMLWLLVETGLIGAALYLIFLGALIRTCFAAVRAFRLQFSGRVAAVLLSAVAAYFVIDFFVLTANSPGHRWYFMALIGGGLRACTGFRCGEA